jgi:ribosomal protein S18 acetylase RimI-like enzyme
VKVRVAICPDNARVSAEPRIRIRPVAASEHAMIGDLVVDAYRTLDVERDAVHDAYEAVMRDVASRAAESDVLVAELDSVVAGTVTYVAPGGALTETDDPEAATIRMLGVRAEGRGHGVGEALVRECIRRARAGGCARIVLHTRAVMVAAQRLYERLGFVRAPALDFRASPTIELRGYVLELDGRRASTARRHGA